MRGVIPPLHQYAFMALYLVKHRENFTFIFTLPSTNSRATQKKHGIRRHVSSAASQRISLHFNSRNCPKC